MILIHNVGRIIILIHHVFVGMSHRGDNWYLASTYLSYSESKSVDICNETDNKSVQIMFSDGFFKNCFVFLINISLKFLNESAIGNESQLTKVMVWYRTSFKTLHEAILIKLLDTYIFIIRQWMQLTSNSPLPQPVLPYYLLPLGSNSYEM